MESLHDQRFTLLQASVVPPNDDGLKIGTTGDDSPYVKNFTQDAKTEVSKPMSVSITVANLMPEIVDEARLKIVDPLEGESFERKKHDTSKLLKLFGMGRRVRRGLGAGAGQHPLGGVGAYNGGARGGIGAVRNTALSRLLRAVGEVRTVKDARVLRAVATVVVPPGDRRAGDDEDVRIRGLQGTGTTSTAPPTVGTATPKTTTSTSTTTADPCNRLLLTQSVSAGLQCGSDPNSKCWPGPKNDGITSRLVWNDIVMSLAGAFELCYCDRHMANRCLLWVKVGNLQVDGPLGGMPTINGNPGSLTKIRLHGLGLSSRDRIHVVSATDTCGTLSAPITTTAAPTTDNSTDNSTTPRRELGVVYQSTVPSFSNSSMLEYTVQFTQELRYKICWCSGKKSACADHKDYQTTAGYIEIAPKVDCLMSDFWIVSGCTKPCAGGIKQKRRRIIKQAQGGGRAASNRNGGEVSSRRRGEVGGEVSSRL